MAKRVNGLCKQRKHKSDKEKTFIHHCCEAETILAFAKQYHANPEAYIKARLEDAYICYYLHRTTEYSAFAARTNFRSGFTYSPLNLEQCSDFLAKVFVPRSVIWSFRDYIFWNCEKMDTNHSDALNAIRKKCPASLDTVLDKYQSSRPRQPDPPKAPQPALKPLDPSSVSIRRHRGPSCLLPTPISDAEALAKLQPKPARPV
jgi:hypothetical protein